MARRKKKEILFVDYYDQWVETYKEGLVRDITLQKYHITSQRLREIAPDLQLSKLDRREYQNILNEYAKTHEKQTTTDFHHNVKGCLKDAFYDGEIDKDPTYKAVIKGKPKKDRKQKFLHQDELKKLISSLNIGQEINRDWFILLVAKTGLRFAEAIALTPDDFDFKNNTLSVNKTLNYKQKSSETVFDLTKNLSSNRTIAIDWQIVGQFGPLIKQLPADQPIFVEEGKRVFNSTYNTYLAKKCEEAGIPVISMHSLRHTHASILLSAGVTLHSIADRLGHADVTTTQETYTHIINELADKDNNKMISTLTALA